MSAISQGQQGMEKAAELDAAMGPLNELYAHRFLTVLAEQGYAPHTPAAQEAAVKQAVLLDQFELPVDKTAAVDPYVASFDRLACHLKQAGVAPESTAARADLALAAVTDPTIYRAALAVSGL